PNGSSARQTTNPCQAQRHSSWLIAASGSEDGGRIPASAVRFLTSAPRPNGCASTKREAPAEEPALRRPSGLSDLRCPFSDLRLSLTGTKSRGPNCSSGGAAMTDQGRGRNDTTEEWAARDAPREPRCHLLCP